MRNRRLTAIQQTVARKERERPRKAYPLRKYPQPRFGDMPLGLETWLLYAVTTGLLSNYRRDVSRAFPTEYPFLMRDAEDWLSKTIRMVDNGMEQHGFKQDVQRRAEPLVKESSIKKHWNAKMLGRALQSSLMLRK